MLSRNRGTLDVTVTLLRLGIEKVNNTYRGDKSSIGPVAANQRAIPETEIPAKRFKNV